MALAVRNGGSPRKYANGVCSAGVFPGYARVVTLRVFSMGDLLTLNISGLRTNDVPPAPRPSFEDSSVPFLASLPASSGSDHVGAFGVLCNVGKHSFWG